MKTEITMKRIAWLGVAFSVVHSGFVAGMDVPDDAEDVQPVAVGDAAPQFTVYEVNGEPYLFEPGKLQKPVVLITYRGGWCPYCNMHLKELREAEPRLLEMGFEVIFLSTDRPEILYASLFDYVKDVEYTLLSDSKMDASRALGIAFRVDDAEYERMKSLGVDLEEASGETHHELPVPAVFIIDTAGTIRFAHVNPDYKVRLEGEAILTAAQQVVN